MNRQHDSIELSAGICLLFIIIFGFGFGCSGNAEVRDPGPNPQQSEICTEGKCVAPIQPAPPQQERRGIVNPKTGEYLPPSGKGVYSPRTGDYYQPTGNGYYNPKTGEFIPKR